jgi:hypothetical protein
LADPLPRWAVVPRELLETERALQTRRAIGGDERRLDRDRPGAAHRIEKRRGRCPPREREDPGGEILAQRRDVRITAPPAFEQRFAGGVEIEGRVVAGEIRVDARVGPALVDRRPLAGVRAETVADRILDLERDELDARERSARRSDVDAQRSFDREVALPVDAVREPVQLVLVAVVPMRNLPQDAARQTRLEVRAVSELERPREADAAFRWRDELRAERGELRCERLLEAARTRRKVAFGHRKSRRRVKTSAT